MYFLFRYDFFFLLSFPGNAILQYTQTFFHLFYCIAGIVTVCRFVCNFMPFVCQEIKGLLTYLLTYLLNN